jgi:signal transduction histidine kinase
MIQSATLTSDEHLTSLAIASSKALSAPLFDFHTAEISIEEFQSTVAQLWEQTPDIHYTIFLTDGLPIIDSHAEPATSNDGNPPELYQVLQAEGSSNVLSRLNEGGTKSLFVPVVIDGQTLGAISLETPQGLTLPSSRRYWIGLTIFSLLVFVGVSALNVLLARRQSTPLERLAVSAGQIASGDLNTRAQIEGYYETQIVANALNIQSSRLQNSLNDLRTFVASASHELRTPLTTVKLRAEALRAGALHDPDVSDRFLTEIEDEIDRLSRMVNDLLDLSRIEADMDTSKHIALNLGKIAAEVGDVFKARADEAGIQIGLKIEPDLPLVLGDEEQLWRVLMNLMDNALNYVPRGGSITLFLAPIYGTAVRLEVQDTGPGIAPEDIPYLFQHFYRTDITRQRSTRSKGSGLGLAMCKAIIEIHGGKIGVDSQLGKGTKFWVELPAQTA